jgi:hypothetical protein
VSRLPFPQIEPGPGLCGGAGQLITEAQQFKERLKAALVINHLMASIR